MAEPEYSEVFAVYVTPKQGLKALVNPMLVGIVDAVTDSEMTAAELSEKLGMSRSTVRSGLERLCRMGILVMRRSESDARRVVFTICAVEAVHSIDPADDVFARIDRLLKCFRGSKPMPIYESILMTMAEMRSRGVTISRVMFETGMALGIALSERTGAMSCEELSAKTKEVLGLDLDLEIGSGPEGVRVRATGGNVAAILLMRELLMGFIIATMNHRTGALHAQHYTTELDEAGGSVVFASRIYSGSMRRELMSGYPDRESTFYRIDNPFMVIYTKAGARHMIVNASMISVLDAIYGGCCSPVGISERTGIPHITVHTVLSKLAAIGAVEKAAVGKEVVARLSCNILIRALHTPSDAPPPMPGRPEPMEIRGFVYRYILWVAESFGIGASIFFDSVGARAGRRLAASYPGIGAQDFLDRFCRNYREDGADIALISYIPVHLLMRIESSQGYFADYIGVFIRSMVEGALEAITGDRYRVNVDVQPLKRTGKLPAPEQSAARRGGEDGGNN